MKILTREQILAADDIRLELVQTPEWDGGVVYVKTMTGGERDRLEASIFSTKGERNMEDLRAKIAALSTVDKEGNCLFSFEDVVALTKKSARPLDRIFAVATRLSGFMPKDVEDLTKNLSAGQDESSSSG